MKKIVTLLSLITLIAVLSACSGYVAGATTEAESTNTVFTTQPVDEYKADAGTIASAIQTPDVTSTPVVVEYDDDDLEIRENSSDVTYVSLEGDAVTFQGGGIAVDDTTLAITSAGTYDISGVLYDGQIVVNTEDDETVVLILNGVDITYATSAPIYVSNAEKTVITLADGSENVVTDGTAYVFPDAETDEPNATIFSKDDLTINGSGALTVNANYSNGIVGKDDLKITGGTINVNAVNDGIKGKDSVAVLDGVITIVASGDGIQATNVEDAEKGYIAIEGGILNVTAGLDAIQAETSLLVSGGDLTLTSGVGSNSAADSTKGLKAGVDLAIIGGNLVIDAADDAIHSDNTLTIDGGSIALASDDDGIRAETSLVINNGAIDIVQSYEGLESQIITINGGTIHITASDDGINVSDGSGATMGGRSMETVSTAYYLEINGGCVFVDAGGDGLDSNGTGTLNDGVVMVNGPTANNNGSLDVGGNLVINGGFLVAVGSAGMAQSPSTASAQYSALVSLPSTLQAGTLVHIESDSGEEILTFAPTKAYQTVVISTPEMENGETYIVYTGGQATGTATDGLYVDGMYTAGTQVSSFTIAGIVTGENTGMGRTSGGNRGRP